MSITLTFRRQWYRFGFKNIGGMLGRLRAFNVNAGFVSITVVYG